MTTYRILEAGGKPQVALKKGFCWPAVFFGVLWALFKSFWSGAIVLLAVAAVTNSLVRIAEQSHSAALIVASLLLWIGASFVVGYYANFAYLAYLTTKGYRVVAQVIADSPQEAFRVLARDDSLQKISGQDREPQGTCPNCERSIALSSALCAHCKAQFGETSAWRVTPITKT